jgi:uncharacterized protein
MRLDDYDPGDNVRDLGRGGGGGGFGGFGGGGSGGGMGGLIGLLPLLFGRRLGCGGIALILVIGAVLMMSSGMLSSVPGPGSNIQPGQQQQAGGQNRACDTEAERFACNVFGSTSGVWARIFANRGEQYREPTLNFFTEQNQSGCGAAQAAMGPFYCPADQGIYIDVSFFDELSQRFGAAGDAAQAYVIAHEVGHHIQTITGRSDQIRRLQSRAGQAESNALQVRMELEADCYAGVWAATARTRAGQPVMEPGDLEEAMRAANAIGDDTLMRSAGQRPVPESFTHGTSAQRMEWLRRGLTTGDPGQCNTFQGV